MPEIPQAELLEFLQTPFNAIVGTNRRDGAPQLSPIWYLYEDGLFYISIGKSTAKYHNLRRDPRISICIDGGRNDNRTVMVYGTVEFIDSMHPQERATRLRLIHHYIRDEQAAREYEEMSREWVSVLLVVTPEQMITQDFR